MLNSHKYHSPKSSVIFSLRKSADFCLPAAGLHNPASLLGDAAHTAEETDDYLTEATQNLEGSNQQQPQEHCEVHDSVSVFFRTRARDFPAGSHVVTGVGVFVTSRRHTGIVQEPLQIEGFGMNVTDKQKRKRNIIPG